MTIRGFACAASVLALSAVAACATTATPISPTGSTTANVSTGVAATLAVGNSNAPMPAPGMCHVGQRNGQPVPDPHCTPGTINAVVTQANINDTICKSGWTSTVRPPTSTTNRMKAAAANAYSLTSDTKGEYDHLVSLELGGAPDDPRNLWVEPGTIPNPKDAVENKLNQAVCSGLIPLAAAQQAIAADWVTAFDEAGLRVSGGKVCLRDQPDRCATGRHGDSD